MATTDAPRTYPLYKYVPSLAAAVLFCVLFGITTLFHIWQIARKRVYFMIPFAIGGVCKSSYHFRTGDAANEYD
jgi:hypothetical protein